MEKLERLKWLTAEINKHNKNYYVYDNPTISDAEYDALYYELVDLEKELNFTMDNSPTSRVGDYVLDIDNRSDVKANKKVTSEGSKESLADQIDK